VLPQPPGGAQHPQHSRRYGPDANPNSNPDTTTNMNTNTNPNPNPTNPNRTLLTTKALSSIRRSAYYILHVAFS